MGEELLPAWRQQRLMSFSPGFHSVSRVGAAQNGARELDQEREKCATLSSSTRLLHGLAINLRLPIKQDHTANMKYTRYVERLIKY
jgi:hypothetical protein